MKGRMAKSLIAGLAILGLAVGFASNPGRVAGWSAFPGGGMHATSTRDVVGWFDQKGWFFEDQKLRADDWGLVAYGAVVPDSIWRPLVGGQWGTWWQAAQQLEDLLLGGSGVDLVTCGPQGCTCNPNQPLCDALKHDFEHGLLKNHDWTQVVFWTQTAKEDLRNGNLELAKIHAGYALHFAQDGVSPSHVEPWASPGPHTWWESHDTSFWAKFGPQVIADLPSDPQTFQSDQSIATELAETLRPMIANDWPDPPRWVPWAVWDPACDVTAPLSQGYCIASVPLAFSCSAAEDCWYSPASARNERGVKNALGTAAGLAQRLLVHIFRFTPTAPPPPPGECTENVDVALIIDSSGSMSWNDPQNLRKEAAKNFVTAMQDKDQVAVVDFSSDLPGGGDARVLFPLAPRTSDTSAIEAAIAQTGAYNATNVRAGVQKGFEQLDGSTRPNAKAAILLSDGEHNTGGDYTDADHQPFKDNGWPIYTVGLHVGGTAGETLLRDIAQDTGGQYFNLTDAGQLVAAYNDIRSRVQCGETQLENTLPVALGQTAEVVAAIPPGQTSAAFLSNWAGSTVDMTLVDPNGRIIGPDSTDPDVAHIKGLVSELYRITNPVPGTWTIRLYGADVPPQGENVTVVVTTVAPPVPPDSTAPTSRVVVPQRHFGSLPIDLSFEAADPAGPGGEEPSGVKHVELWYRYRGLLKMPPLESLSPEQIRPQDFALARGWSGWTQYDGTFAASPISFTPPSGSGLYEFYTIAVDNAGNTEESPATADARYLCIVHGERGFCVSMRWLLLTGLPEIIPGSPGFGR